MAAVEAKTLQQLNQLKTELITCEEECKNKKNAIYRLENACPGRCDGGEHIFDAKGRFSSHDLYICKHCNKSKIEVRGGFKKSKRKTKRKRKSRKRKSKRKRTKRRRKSRRKRKTKKRY